MDVDYRLLAVLIGKLPKDGTWTPAQRARWLEAFMKSLDYLVVTEEASPC